MFIKIGKLYNTNLPDEKVQTLINELGGMDLENGFFGLICPISKKYNEKLNNLFLQKNGSGYHIQIEKLDKKEHVSRLIAYFGYVFLDAIEQIWEEFTEEQLKDADLILDRLRGVLKRRFQEK